MKGWKEVQLRSITSKIGSGVTPKGGASVYIDKGTALIRSQNIYNGSFEYKGLVFVNEITAYKMRGVEIFKNDILINITGDSVARCTIVPDNLLPARVNQHVAIIRCKEDVDSAFVMYSLTSPIYQAKLLSIATGAGATRNALTKVILEDFKINLPPLPIQLKVSSILSTYDNLIENNLKRIKLLEELAQRTYEEWFVKFCINGKQLKLKEETALPEGWEKKPFEDLIDFKEGPGLRNSQYREEGIPFLNIRVIKEDEVDFNKVQFLDPVEVNSKYPHFLLKENDHVISTSGTLGRLVTIRKRHLPLCLNTSLIRMRPINENYGKWLIKHTLTNPKFKELMESYANGSAQKNFGPIHLKQIKLVAPKMDVAKSYEKFADPLEKMIQNLKDQNIHLKESRDILLLRLMSGVIEVG